MRTINATTYKELRMRKGLNSSSLRGKFEWLVIYAVTVFELFDGLGLLGIGIIGFIPGKTQIGSLPLTSYIADLHPSNYNSNGNTLH